MTRGRIWTAAGLLIAAAIGAGGASSGPLPPAPSWNVVLKVKAEGDYRSESSQARTDGTYSAEFEWTGTIAKDGDDFLLVHTGCVLKEWRIEERTSEGEIIRMLSERDAPDKPELKVNYALNIEGRVRFDFAVSGIDVPLDGSAQSFPLILPVSAESGSKAGTIAYNTGVNSGSNDVAVDAARLARGSVEEIFTWAWRRQAWVQKSDSVIFQANGHKAKVALTITPR